MTEKTSNLLIKNNGNLSETFAKMQDSLSPDFAIEIGAHAAEFSNHMASKLKIQAVAFEAGKDIYEKYKNTVEPLVSYVHCAISNIDGTATFFVHHGPLRGNNGIKRVNFRPSYADSEVPCYRLDTYLNNHSFENACLWIDVEGANREVLTGAVETLNKTSSIFIETEDSETWEDQWLTTDVIKYLESLGFTKVASEQVYNIQQNIIFIKKSVLKNGQLAMTS
jgi:FkbM family methyltransferase